ncbi:MAG TPA: hypothetical protein ENI26_06320 [Methylophaga aminisulfidivorans]|uniref:Uncharacterized protein n=1 Tax=Methylophaga aminisulfidivorans TaxID=230105 RepID=A0A7C2AB20_9GAMM|nr:hypothetical protein [Methylophaga aminisulfidivorans]
MTKLTKRQAEDIQRYISEQNYQGSWSSEFHKLFEPALEALMEYETERHITIPWETLPEDSPIKKFAEAYNYHNDDCCEGYEFCEHVLTEFSNIEKLDALKIYNEEPNTQDFFVCAQLLKSGYNLSPKLIGEILERVIEEAGSSRADVPSLGIKKIKRGRPTNKKHRQWYLDHLVMKVSQLTEKNNMTLTDAYESIAREKHKSPATIRRDYERYIKARKEQRNHWKRKDGEK